MTKTVVVAVFWVGFLVVLKAALGVDPGLRSLQYFPDMAVSRAAESQRPFPGLPGATTQQSPPPGTVPRGMMPLAFSRDEAGRRAAGDALVNPYAPPVPSDDRPPGGFQPAPAAPAGPERGRVLYRRFCLPCHGPQGHGNGPVSQRGYPPPPALQRDVALQYRDGEIFHIITYGLGNMPGYGSQVSREDRWLIVNHVRTLQQPPAAALTGGAQ